MGLFSPRRVVPGRRRLLGALAGLGAMAALAAAPRPARAGTDFDATHAAWTTLLQRHVVTRRDGHASRVRYAGFAADRAALREVLQTLSDVPEGRFGLWPRAARMAFLINAYNAFTVDFVLTRYPGLQSIKELGGVLQSPWKVKRVPLFGRKVSLDDIEHEMLRRRGAYDDPRVHFAVNCASVGCPALREEAYVGARLEAQLEDQTQRFLADRSRNRWDPQRGRLEVSRVFDWYGDDFRLGHLGIGSLPAFFARHAERLADAEADRARIRAQQAEIVFLDYDWSLNDAR